MLKSKRNQQRLTKYETDTAMAKEAQIINVLMPDEEILWKGKPQKDAYVLGAVLRMMPVALLWLVIDVSFIVLMCVFGIFDEVPWIVAIIVPFFLLHLSPVWIWIGNIIKHNVEYKNVEFAVTNTRVIAKSGVIGIDFVSVMHAEIDSVNVKVGVVDKMLKVGDVWIIGKNAKISICDIPDAYDVMKIVQNAVYEAKSDMQYPNALRPDKN